MSQKTISLRLPVNLANEAEANGLLSSEVIEVLLREALRRRRVDQLFQKIDRLAALDLPPLTQAEVEAEIQTARHFRRSADASGR